jgi:integrase
MGTAEPSSSGKSWRARWKGPEGTTPEYPSQSGFKTEAAARKYANDQEAAIRARRYIDPKLAETPVDQWWQRWFPAQDHLRPNSRDAYEQNYRLHIKPRWGSLPMGPVLPIEIQEYRAELRKSLGESTVTLIMSIMRGMFDDAMLNRLIQTSPFAGGHRRNLGKRGNIKAGSKPKREPLLIDLDQLDQICARLNHADALLATTVFWTGMRWSEVAAMRCSFLHLEPEAGVVDEAGYYLIDPAVGAVHEDVHSSRFLGPPKSGATGRLTTRHKAGRVMDLPPFLAAMLREHVAGLPEDRDAVFTNRNGRFHGHDTWMVRWRRACDTGTAADPEPIAETLRIHDGKHFHGAKLDELGIHTVMRDYRLGHATPGVRGVYSHPTIDMRLQLISKLQEAWEAHQVHRNDSAH